MLGNKIAPKGGILRLRSKKKRKREIKNRELSPKKGMRSNGRSQNPVGLEREGQCLRNIESKMGK